ncbi:MAG TPA: alkaline phosphatase family protein [Candidatus Binatia bacterium]|nr:alkaline phosphatase family protein [Candidatus Binatia bacterium]
MAWLDRLRRGGAKEDERPLAERPAAPAAGQVAVIGLDGVGLPLVQDLIARGITPNLARLVASGTLAPMRSSIPTISSVSWTGFMTGKNPGKHGVYGFTDLKPGTMSMFFPNFGNVHGDTLWDVAGRAGKRCIVLNIPNTYPARVLNGLLVSGFVAVKLERAVYPPDLLSRLTAGGYRIDVDYVNADQRPDHFFADLGATLDARLRAYLELVRGEPWDLFIGVITECDRLHHYFWSQYVDPAAPHHGRFLDFYRRLDDAIGELVAALPAGIPLFVVADHGHTLIHREVFPNAWLREQGLLRFTTEKPRSPADIDPSSKVFVLDPGRIYLHRKGRYPLGTVDDAEAAALLERVRSGLLALRDDSPGAPAGGRPVPRVFDRDELYHGPCLDAAPDLVMHFNDGYDPKGAMARAEVFGRSALTGMHTYADSLFYVNRAGVSTDDLDIVDLAPTILTLLGLEPPADMDGQVRLPG